MKLNNFPSIAKSHPESNYLGVGTAASSVTSFAEIRFKELKATFEAVCHQEAKHISICLLVDGLDEFEGDQRGLVDLLIRSSTSSRTLKVIASSRDEPVFIDSLQACPRLDLPKLTRADMRNYITDIFGRHDKFQVLQKTNPTGCANLCETIINQSSGVFLWVRLVVASIYDGLSDGNHLDELLTVVKKMPKELKDLFSSMLARMKPDYLPQASMLFQ